MLLKNLARGAAAAIWNPPPPHHHTHTLVSPASSVTRVFGLTPRTTTTTTATIRASGGKFSIMMMTMMISKHNEDKDGRDKAVVAGNAWCCTASMAPNTTNGNDSVEIQKVNGYTDSSSDDDTDSCRPFAQIILEHMSNSNDTTDESSSSSSSSSSSLLLKLDLTTSPDWMQYIEFKEDRRHDEGGAGAYDTLRCDLILSPSQKTDSDHNKNMQTDTNAAQWRIWGRDFHLQRLEKSFASLLVAAAATATRHHGDDNGQQQNAACLKRGAVERAIQNSHRIFDALLTEAAASLILNQKLQQQQMHGASRNDVTIQLIKFTWLWSLSKPKTEDDSNSNNNEQDSNNDDDARDIVVRGHACSTAKPMQIHCPMTPIAATIAARATRQNNKDDSNSSISWSLDTSLPTRHGDDDNINDDDDTSHDYDHGAVNNPQQKVASWTRMRQKMEHGKHAYKPVGFPNAEVLMVRKAAFNHDIDRDDNGDDEFEILEGLSSNFFAIYKNGTIKTATKGVLYGYARHLVLDIVEEQNSNNACSSSSLGLRFVDEPILLSESSEWVETFITSSSRLIYPISHILMHTQKEHGNNEEATANNDKDDEDTLPAGFEPFWSDPLLTRSRQEQQTSTLVKPKWQIILDEILRRHGYP